MTFTNKTVSPAYALDEATEAQTPRERRLPEMKVLLAREDVQQFLKFIVVGASNFIINFVAYNLLYHGIFHMPLVTALTLAFLISGVNGFIWSKYWTFKSSDKTKSAATLQYVKFMIVAVIGWAINTSITVSLVAAYFEFHTGNSSFSQVLADSLHGGKAPAPVLVANGALVCASAVVIVWNFLANRYWTFKK